MDAGHVLLQAFAALHRDAVLAGVGVRRERGDRHGRHHAELVGHLLLVHTGGLHGLGHPAAALPLEPLEVLLHLAVDGLFRVVEQRLVGLLLAGQLPGGVVAHAVLVNGLELDAVVDVVLVLVEVGHALLPAEQPPALFLLLFLPGLGGLGFLLGQLHRASGVFVQIRLGLLLLGRLWLGGPLGLLHLRGRLRPGRGLGSRLLGNRLGRLLPGLGRPLGRLPLGGGTPGGLGRCRTLPQVLLGGALGCLYLPLGPLFRQNIFQGKVLVIL